MKHLKTTPCTNRTYPDQASQLRNRPSLRPIGEFITWHILRRGGALTEVLSKAMTLSSKPTTKKKKY